jgi:predicted phage tail protein
MTGLAAGATFHFRARLVDRTGNVGPWSDWVMGQSSVDATIILEAIAGQISETELGQHLQERLDKIDGNGPGSVNERLQSVTDVLAYVPAKAYGLGETVRQGQRLYQATQDVPAEMPPPNADYWLDIGQLVQQANALAGQVSQNTAAIEQTEQGLQAQAERLEGVFAQVNPPQAGDMNWNAGSTTTMAGVWSEQSARADAVSAVAQRIDTVIAELGEDLAATVEQTSKVVANLDGKLSAMWSVKLGVTSGGQYYAAGMGIGIENTPEGMQSQVLFQADRFAVINTANGQISTPFVIQGGQVFINSAVIGDGTIDMAKIATALQSTNYVAGQTGWRLDKAGTFEINGGVPGQGRMQMTHRALKFWDGNNVLRVQAGDLTA